MIEIPTEACVDSLSGKKRNRRDLSTVCNNQVKKPDKNLLTILGSLTAKRHPSLDGEVSNKNYIDSEIAKILVSDAIRHWKTLSKGLFESLNKILPITNKKNIVTTISKDPNTGGHLLKTWNMKCNDKNNNGKVPKFLKSTRTSSPPGNKITTLFLEGLLN